MKILTDDHMRPTRRKEVELTDEELKRSDADIITAADNNGEWDKGVFHFGGYVERRFRGERNRALVAIYND